MKNLLSFVVLLMFASTGVSAQVRRNTDSSQTRVANNSKKVEKIQTLQNLNLTKEQRGQLKELGQSQKQQRQAIMDDQALSDLQRRQNLKRLRAEQNEKLQSILTPEQMEQWKQEHQNNMHQRRQNKNTQPDSEEGLNDSKQESDSTK